MSGRSWDHVADIVIVGSGAAGYSAAITARSRGAEVIMIEKAASHGGTTMRSGGGFWTPNNRFQREKGIDDPKEDAVRYMARYSFPQLFNPNAPRLGLPQNEYDLITAFYDNASRMTDFLTEVGAVNMIQQINWTGKPQVDYQDHLPENKGIRGRVLYPMTKDGKMSYGFELIRQFKAWADAHGTSLVLDHRVSKIVRNGQGEVIGVEATNNNSTVSFRAKKAVIFCSGGFTHHPDLMLHFQRGPHFGGCSVPTNTGDFVFLGGAIGAQLGNMAGAFRSELVLEQALSDPGGSHNAFFIMGDSVIEVNRYGHRIMDEKRNYTDRAMVHFVWDPQRAEWTNMLVFLIFDKRTADLWNGVYPVPGPGASAPYIIKGDSMEELSESIRQRLIHLAPQTGGFQLDNGFPGNLKKTVKRFNKFAASGSDLDFHRGDFAYDREWPTFPPTASANADMYDSMSSIDTGTGERWPPKGSKNYTMFPISEKGPYYAIIMAAGTLDTNGGPLINSKAQVLDTQNRPIPGLYGAGNCI
ncbi:MAG: FAD-dependent oxidoreductase, partial [Methanomassiliicoccales archaeon]